MFLVSVTVVITVAALSSSAGFSATGVSVASSNLSASPAGHPRGEVRWPILSVVSMGTLVPLRNRLSRLNHAMVAMYLRVVVVPNVSSRD